MNKRRGFCSPEGEREYGFEGFNKEQVAERRDEGYFALFGLMGGRCWVVGEKDKVRWRRLSAVGRAWRHSMAEGGKTDGAEEGK